MLKPIECSALNVEQITLIYLPSPIGEEERIVCDVRMIVRRDLTEADVVSDTDCIDLDSTILSY